MTEDYKTNFLPKIISLFLFVQSIFILWQIIKALDVFVVNLFYIILYGSYLLSAVLLIIAGIGIILQKRWAIVVYWLFVILPIFLMLIRTNLIHRYVFIVLNAILVTFLSVKYWNRWGVAKIKE